MLKKVIPTSNAACLEFLNAAVNAHTNDQSTGKVLLRPETADKVQLLAHDFRAANAAVARQKEQRTRASRIVDESTDLLGTSLTDLYKSTRTRVSGGRLPKELLTHYGLPQKGRTPRPSDREGWLPLAVATLEGHYAAQATGLPTLDISEVEQDLAQAQMAVAELNQIRDRLKDAQIERRALRPQITQLARSVSFELYSLLLTQPASTRRDIMRAYGIEWKSSKGNGAENGTSPAALAGAGAAGEVSSAD